MRLDYISQGIGDSSENDIIANEAGRKVELRAVGIGHAIQNSPEPMCVGCDCPGAVAYRRNRARTIVGNGNGPARSIGDCCREAVGVAQRNRVAVAIGE